MSSQHFFLQSQGRPIGAGRAFRAMETGRVAAGHGLYIDATTGTGVVEAVQRAGGKVKAYISHDHRGPGSREGAPGSEILECIGVFSGVRMADGIVFFDHFEPLPSFVANESAKLARLSDLIEREAISLSLELGGRAVFIDENGDEHPTRDPGKSYLYNGLPVLRVDAVFGCAFVAAGAATSSLFSRFTQAVRAILGRDRNPWAASTKNFTEQARISNAAPALAAALKAEAEEPAASFPPAARDDSLLDEVKKRFASDRARMVRALEMLADSSASGIGEIEVRLLEAEKRELTASLATAKNALAAAQTTLVATQTERDEWKAKFTAIKDSGAPAVDLGPQGFVSMNPWAEGTRNYTEQARISNTNPALAAHLRALAGKAA